MKLENCKVGMEVKAKTDFTIPGTDRVIPKGTRGIIKENRDNDCVYVSFSGELTSWWILPENIKPIKEKIHVDISKVQVEKEKEVDPLDELVVPYKDYTVPGKAGYFRFIIVDQRIKSMMLVYRGSETYEVPLMRNDDFYVLLANRTVRFILKELYGIE